MDQKKAVQYCALVNGLVQNLKQHLAHCYLPENTASIKTWTNKREIIMPGKGLHGSCCARTSMESRGCGRGRATKIRNKTLVRFTRVPRFAFPYWTHDGEHLYCASGRSLQVCSCCRGKQTQRYCVRGNELVACKEWNMWGGEANCLIIDIFASCSVFNIEI